MKSPKATYIKSAAKPEGYPPPQGPEVAVVGRSNVGKSSLLNRLIEVQGLARTSKTPGRTQLIHFFATRSGFTLVDLPGYGFAKVPEAVRREWKPMIEDYLKSRKNLVLVLALVDARHDPSAEDRSLRQWLGDLNIPFLIVATKADKLSHNELSKKLVELKSMMGLEQWPLPFSSTTGKGRDELMGHIRQRLEVFAGKKVMDEGTQSQGV
jgi:GTP-binding protein